MPTLHRRPRGPEAVGGPLARGGRCVGSLPEGPWTRRQRHAEALGGGGAVWPAASRSRQSGDSLPGVWPAQLGSGACGLQSHKECALPSEARGWLRRSHRSWLRGLRTPGSRGERFIPGPSWRPTVDPLPRSEVEPPTPACPETAAQAGGREQEEGARAQPSGHAPVTHLPQVPPAPNKATNYGSSMG